MRLFPLRSEGVAGLEGGEDAVDVVVVLADDALELGHAPAAQPQVEDRLHAVRLRMRGLRMMEMRGLKRAQDMRAQDDGNEGAQDVN